MTGSRPLSGETSYEPGDLFEAAIQRIQRRLIIQCSLLILAAGALGFLAGRFA
jgi:hypothetical protein